MRRLIPALILTLSMLALAAPPASASTPKVAPTTCISLPELHLPSVCDIKAGTFDLVAKLAIQINVSLSAVLTLGAQLGALIGGGINAGLQLVLSLPALLVKLLCL